MAYGRAYLCIGVCALSQCFGLGRASIALILEGAEGIIHAATWRRVLSSLGARTAFLSIATDDSVQRRRRSGLAVGRSYFPGRWGQRIGLLLVLLAKEEGHGVRLGVGELCRPPVALKHAFGLRCVDQLGVWLLRAKGRLGTGAEVRSEMCRRSNSGVLIVPGGCAHIAESIAGAVGGCKTCCDATLDAVVGDG